MNEDNRSPFTHGKGAPEDRYNEELVAKSILPLKNPEPAEGYNLVVLGAGTAGLVTAAGRRHRREGGVAGAAPARRRTASMWVASRRNA